MRCRTIGIILGIVGSLALAGCSRDREPTLRDLRSMDRSPEEFSVVPQKPLEQPPSLDALPEPSPGAPNRTDATPRADAIAALGGNPGAGATRSGGVPATDGALVERVSRFGRASDIRETLAEEDLALRRSRSRFTWSIVPRDDYSRAYRDQALDPRDWAERYRRSGIPVPAAPPG